MNNRLFFVGMVTTFSLLFFNSPGIAQEKESERGLKPGQQVEAGQINPNAISLDIKGMDVVDVLKMLATRSGMNIVVGKNVTGRVSLFLKNVDVKDAFEIILLANDLACERKGDILNVITQRDYELIYGERYQDKKHALNIQLKYAKAADLSRSLNQIKSNIGKVVVDEASNTVGLIDTIDRLKEMENFIRKTDLPIQSKVFSLSYGQADKIQPKIQEIVTKGVGSLKFDERTNKIVVADYPAKLEEIGKIITAFDEKTPQVLIDAQIIEIRPSDKFEMGVDWEYFIKKHFDVAASLPISQAGRLLVGTPNVKPTKPGQYKAIVDVLRTIGDTKILSSPRIMAMNNQESKILVGTKDAYITSATSQTGTTAVTSQSVNFVDTGIKLYVTPTITRDGFVTMKIRPEVSSSQRVSIKAEDKVTEIPIVSTSEAETTVMVKDGVTIIIGGLRKDERTKTVAKIPILGDIPLVGAFFRNTSDELKKTELVILLTPHIMSGEFPYTEISEIKPREGAVLKMSKGEIVTEKITTPRNEKNPAFSENMPDAEYYKVIVRMINQSANLYSPVGKKGRVELNFSVYSDGKLEGEPEIVNVTDSSLIPFAVKTIKDASPFPPFPRSLAKDKASFKLSLNYE